MSVDAPSLTLWSWPGLCRHHNTIENAIKPTYNQTLNSFLSYSSSVCISFFVLRLIFLRPCLSCSLLSYKCLCCRRSLSIPVTSISVSRDVCPLLVLLFRPSRVRIFPQTPLCSVPPLLSRSLILSSSHSASYPLSALIRLSVSLSLSLSQSIWRLRSDHLTAVTARGQDASLSSIGGPAAALRVSNHCPFLSFVYSLLQRIESSSYIPRREMQRLCN